MIKRLKMTKVFDVVLKSTPENIRGWLTREVKLIPDDTENNAAVIKSLSFSPVLLGRDDHGAEEWLALMPEVSNGRSSIDDFEVKAYITKLWEDEDGTHNIISKAGDGIYIELRPSCDDRTQVIGKCLSPFSPQMEMLKKDLTRIFDPWVEKPAPGSSAEKWLNYYNAMNDAGYKYTLRQLAKESRYTEQHLKNLHSRDKSR